MELVEIQGLFQMDCGAPSPIILSDDNELFLAFYTNDNHIVQKFENCMKYTFGMPNDEALDGHPYYKIGLESYAFYELKESDWLASLQEMSKVHQHYDAERWKHFKHYILTFHDNMFECIAKSFEILEENTQAATLFAELKSRYNL
jgi:hypothetical protein